eukprot:6820248-Prorocentrum_lima.AAC.1
MSTGTLSFWEQNVSSWNMQDRQDILNVLVWEDVLNIWGVHNLVAFHDHLDQCHPVHAVPDLVK